MLRTGLHKVAVENVEFGMYVAKLDRPWLETDFRLQGFYVRDQATKAKLIATCAYVLVDPMKYRREMNQENSALKTSGNASGSQQRSRANLRVVVSNAAPLENKDRPRPKLRRVMPRQPMHYEDQVDAAQEFVPAKTSVEDAVSILQPVIEKVRNSGQLEVDQVELAVTPLVDSVLRNKDAVAALLRIRALDDYTYSHSIANAVWVALLGRQLGYTPEQINQMALGCALLDIGKVTLPTTILTKADKLTASEWETVHGHVAAGLAILEESNVSDRDVLTMVAMHHERLDGSGYPNKLVGNAIPVYGQIAGIVDTYDAMITEKPYAAAISSYDAVNKLHKQVDVQFQKELVDALIQAIGVFPTGTLVELNTGEVGIVKSQNPNRRLRPKVTLLMNERKKRRVQPIVTDLNDMDTDGAKAPTVWIKRELPRGTFEVKASDFFGS